jgi:prephenate dehydratase
MSCTIFILLAIVAASLQAASSSSNNNLPSSVASPRFPPRSPKGNNSIILPRGALREIRSVIESASTVTDDASSSTPSSLLQRGGATPTTTTTTPAAAKSTTSPKPIRVAFQGEAGAYSEKSLRELLGPNVISVPRPNFEACYRAVASKEADYACVPIENSLGGSIHENYDLMLRYDLTIVAEHDFRVRHCLLTKHGVEEKDIKYAISHSQALSQCDNYLRARGITPKATYDTAGSAKIISKAIRGEAFGRQLPEGCTPENTAAIASDLAGQTFGLECKAEGIEDDDSNFTRFLLLGRTGVVQHLNKKIPSKTSLVFTLPNSAGALYKSLACFSLREIDMSKIESRPMSAGLLNYLRFRNTVTQMGGEGGTASSRVKDMPRFRYCFYLDILESELDERVQNALHHLREQSDYCRILGSYPANSRLVGPVADAVEALNAANAGKKVDSNDLRLKSLPSDDEDARKLNIGFVGYGSFGQYLSKKMSSHHKLRCIDPLDKVCVVICLAVCLLMLFTQILSHDNPSHTSKVERGRRERH